MDTFTFKKDKYRANRGNYSRFLNIYCGNCGEFILLYQKDGSGPLKRLYFDRMFAPNKLAKIQDKNKIGKLPNLVCKKCKRLIGVPSIHEKDNRKVYLLLSFAVIKKMGRGIYPPQELRIAAD